MTQPAKMHRPLRLEDIKIAIARRDVLLPTAVARVAREALEYPDMIAFESTTAIARRCEVGVSTVVRLPFYFGFDDFGDMRGFFRKVLVERARSHGQQF